MKTVPSKTGMALAAILLLAGCNRNNVDVQPERDASGAAVQTPQGSSYSYVGRAEDALSLSAATLLDRQTGCEYVVTAIGVYGVSATPRMVPDAQGDPQQRCGRPSDLDGFAWLGSQDDALRARVSVIRDRRMGCEYVVGTNGGKGGFVIPRMMRRDDGRVAQRCLAAGTPSTTTEISAPASMAAAPAAPDVQPPTSIPAPTDAPAPMQMPTEIGRLPTQTQAEPQP